MWARGRKLDIPANSRHAPPAVQPEAAVRQLRGGLARRHDVPAVPGAALHMLFCRLTFDTWASGGSLQLSYSSQGALPLTCTTYYSLYSLCTPAGAAGCAAVQGGPGAAGPCGAGGHAALPRLRSHGAAHAGGRHGGGGGLCSGGMGGEVACGGSCGCPLGLCMVASSPAGAMLWRPQRPPLVYKHASAQPRLPACPLPSAGLLIHVVPLRRPLLLRLRQAQGQRRAVDPFGCGFSPDCCSCCSGPA